MPKRSRDPLAINAREFRYVSDTSKNCYLEGSLAMRHPTSSQIKTKRRNGLILNTPSNNLNDLVSVEISDEVHNSPGFYAARRDAIHYCYLLFGSPSKDEIDNEVVSEISRRLLIPANSRRNLLNILEDIIDSIGRQYNSKRRLQNFNSTINDHDEEAQIIMDYIEKGLGITQTTFLVNVTRGKNGKSLIARNTVQNYIKRTSLIERTIRHTKVCKLF